MPPTPVVVALPGEAVLAKCPTSCAVLWEGSGLNNMSFLVARGGVGKEKGVGKLPHPPTNHHSFNHMIIDTHAALFSVRKSCKMCGLILQGGIELMT